MADAFAFPSYYEVFPLVALEAAGAARPLLATPVYGIEEFLDDGKNGIALERSEEGIARAIARFVALSAAERRAMGEVARRDVARYATAHYVASWRAFYDAESLGHVA
jgi:glycosyltransferase involved in cell wall biosynthesis